MAIQTRLGLSGTPGRPYAAWQAKAPTLPLTISGAMRWAQRYFLRLNQSVYRRVEKKA